MKFLTYSTFYSVLAIALTTSIPAFADRIIHRENSLYSHIVVKQDGNVICLQFDVRRNLRNQTCMNQRRPKEMVFAYTKMSMATLLFTPEPKKILVVGLGGGTLPMAFADLVKEVEIDSIEIDPAVVKIAEKYFGYQSTKNVRVHEQDARVWVKRTRLRGQQQYDVIILDAFNGEYIPEHLMTVEFFDDLRALLAPGGTLAANTFTISKLYNHESATFAAVFGDFINFRVTESANRLVVVPTNEITDEALRTRAQDLEEALKPYKIPIKRYAKILTKARKARPDWNQDARPLTDQYSPANLLQAD